MKFINLFFSSLILYLINVSSAQVNDFSKLTGPYLGQKPPGNIPEIFAPGIVSTKEPNIHSTASFTPDGKTLFYARLFDNPHYAATFCLAELNGNWENIELDPSFKDCFSPTLSYDGKLLLISRKNSLSYSNCINDTWSPVKNFGQEINFQKRQDGASIDKNGTIFFTSMFGSIEGIFYSKNENGKYSKAEKFHTEYSGRPSDGYPFIAPDQSYIIFMSCRKGGFGMWDLYVSFNKKDGTWTKPVNMGQRINTEASESFPSVSTDGKYLFFNSNRKSNLVSRQPDHFYGNIYWISAKIIEELRPKE